MYPRRVGGEWEEWTSSLQTITPMRAESTGFSAYDDGERDLDCRTAQVDTNHEAKVAPLVQEVPVDVDAIGFAEVLGDQGTDGGEVLFLQPMLVLDIAKLAEYLSDGSSSSHYAES